ncbi:MAG TPA: metallophosphoesterase [Puia sp.]|jgi:predicted MPP superfamily phosphohydrolase|nr:metallophosphoesterase [Puia sp.]
MRSSSFIWIVLCIMVLLDFYVFQAVKVVAQGASPKVKTLVYYFYWSVSVAALVTLALMPITNFENWPRVLRNYILATILGLLFAKLLATIFFLVDDIRRLMQWASGKLFFRNTEAENMGSEGISRSVFLSWVGLGVGGGLFSALVYGFSNKYNYQVRRLQLSFDNLPPSFKGLKIVQISDIHSGSFNNKNAVRKGVDKILKEKADIILFTGDLVNDRASEMHDYMDVFNRLKAPMGVYSTLGNHDYGDYYYGTHPSGEKAIEKEKNLQRVKALHAELGWKLLLDENVLLYKGGEHIALIGVQNISGRRGFQTYGSLPKAYTGAEQAPFKILMSHDPSHWDVEVVPKYPEIDLALAGHTHGMQFGVELPGFKWSPVQYIYKEWAGLYEHGKQKLYVNRGYGFIGYPGRVGILPEITVIELV